MPVLLLDSALFEVLDSHLYPSVSIHISDKADKPQALFNEDQAKTKTKTATMIFAFDDQGWSVAASSIVLLFKGQRCGRSAVAHTSGGGYPRQYLYIGRSKG